MRKFSSTAKLVIVVFLATTAALSGYIGLLLYIKGANQDVAELRSVIDQQLYIETQLKSIESILEDTKKDRERLNSYFVGQNDVVAFIEKIESLGAFSSTAVEILTVDIAQGGSEAYQFLTLKLSTKGSWDATTHFVSLLETLPNFIVIRQANLGSKLKGEERGVWDGVYAIDVAMLK